MIRDITIDQALIELKRAEKALLALREARKAVKVEQLAQMSSAPATNGDFSEQDIRAAMSAPFVSPYRKLRAINAAAKRASLDLTRKLADLRAGR